MSTNEILIWGIVVMTFLVLVVMGPGMWSSHADSLMEKPLKWLKERREKSEQKRS